MCTSLSAVLEPDSWRIRLHASWMRDHDLTHAELYRSASTSPQSVPAGIAPSFPMVKTSISNRYVAIGHLLLCATHPHREHQEETDRARGLLCCQFVPLHGQRAVSPRRTRE